MGAVAAATLASGPSMPAPLRAAIMAGKGEAYREAATKVQARSLHKAFAHNSNLLNGPPARQLERDETIKNPPAALRGSSGIPRDKDGLPKQEQNPDLQPLKARGSPDDPGVYDEMLRTDGTVAGLSGFIKRSVSSAPADIWIPPSPTMAEGRAAELMARFYGIDGGEAWLRGGLPRHVRQALRSMDYGFQGFEVAWEPWVWRGQVVLAPSGVYQRASRSIKGWVWDGDRLAGAVQEVDAPSALAKLYGLDGASLGFRNKKRVVIPAEQLLLYTYDPSGEVDGNPEGVSIYRPGYIWWRTSSRVRARSADSSPGVSRARRSKRERDSEVVIGWPQVLRCSCCIGRGRTCMCVGVLTACAHAFHREARDKQTHQACTQFFVRCGCGNRWPHENKASRLMGPLFFLAQSRRVSASALRFCLRRGAARRRGRGANQGAPTPSQGHAGRRRRLGQGVRGI